MAKKQLLTFPAAIGKHLALKKPDTKFDDNGVYKADFVLSEKEAAPFIKQLKAMAKAYVGKPYPDVTTSDSKAMKAANPLYLYVADEEGNRTGEVLFKCRVKNVISKKTGELWDRRPALIDSLKRPVDVNPWGGSKIRVQVEVVEGSKPEKYLKLVPIVVQVIDLVEGGRGDMDAFGEEDGFAADETNPLAGGFDTENTAPDDADY